MHELESRVAITLPGFVAPPCNPVTTSLFRGWNCDLDLSRSPHQVKLVSKNRPAHMRDSSSLDHADRLTP